MVERTGPERPPLSGDTLQFMRHMWELVHALDVRSKRMAKELGVTGPQRLVIRLLGQSPDMTATDLAETLNIHPSTLTGVLRRLEAQNLIVRRPDHEDRRRMRLRLTARGSRIDRERKGTVEGAVRRTLGDTDEATMEVVQDFLARLTRELSRPE